MKSAALYAVPRTARVPSRAGRRERHRTETRDRLYRAALSLFAERGFLETTVEDITEAADVGKVLFSIISRPRSTSWRSSAASVPLPWSEP